MKHLIRRKRNAKSAGGVQSNYQEHPQVSPQMSVNILKYSRRCQATSNPQRNEGQKMLTAMPNAEVPWAAGNSPVIAQTFSASSLRYGRIDTTMWPTLARKVQLKT